MRSYSLTLIIHYQNVPLTVEKSKNPSKTWWSITINQSFIIYNTGAIQNNPGGRSVKVNPPLTNFRVATRWVIISWKTTDFLGINLSLGSFKEPPLECHGLVSHDVAHVDYSYSILRLKNGSGLILILRLIKGGGHLCIGYTPR